MNMTTTPNPPPAAPLTAEEIAAIRTLNAQRDSECPWLMRTAEIRWQLERVARDAIIPALDMIEARDRDNAALRDRLALVEARIRTYASKCADIEGEYHNIEWHCDQCVPAIFENRILEVGLMASDDAPTDGAAQKEGTP